MTPEPIKTDDADTVPCEKVESAFHSAENGLALPAVAGSPAIVKPRRRIRFPGIEGYANELGVTRTHLYFVLTGQRVSASLVRRYNTLRERDEAAGLLAGKPLPLAAHPRP